MAATNGICLACGEPGKHFRSPTMGKFAYYTCAADTPLTPTPRRHVAHVTTRRG